MELCLKGSISDATFPTLHSSVLGAPTVETMVYTVANEIKWNKIPFNFFYYVHLSN